MTRGRCLPRRGRCQVSAMRKILGRHSTCRPSNHGGPWHLHRGVSSVEHTHSSPCHMPGWSFCRAQRTAGQSHRCSKGHTACSSAALLRPEPAIHTAMPAACMLAGSKSAYLFWCPQQGW